MYLNIFVIGCLVTDETDRNPCSSHRNESEQAQNVLIEKVEKKMKINLPVQANEQKNKPTQTNG